MLGCLCSNILPTLWSHCDILFYSPLFKIIPHFHILIYQLPAIQWYCVGYAANFHKPLCRKTLHYTWSLYCSCPRHNYSYLVPTAQLPHLEGRESCASIYRTFHSTSPRPAVMATGTTAGPWRMKIKLPARREHGYLWDEWQPEECSKALGAISNVERAALSGLLKWQADRLKGPSRLG